ncbi:hypothetical protein C8F04DRAFT_1103187 [Mycena alexandri]|uniref:Uncharacterized protein n=1 Tax=Mycena alexandri TaxID=1745969 RepID=A0AAD6SU83_9AGAR|nr:hypothetical protein C8F04DRAFT_1103187 [Mycena alexandri]
MAGDVFKIAPSQTHSTHPIPHTHARTPYHTRKQSPAVSSPRAHKTCFPSSPPTQSNQRGNAARARRSRRATYTRATSQFPGNPRANSALSFSPPQSHCRQALPPRVRGRMGGGTILRVVVREEDAGVNLVAGLEFEAGEDDEMPASALERVFERDFEDGADNPTPDSIQELLESRLIVSDATPQID